MPVGDINFCLYICPGAPSDARIDDSRIAVGVVRHAPGMRSTELDVFGAGTFVQRAACGLAALLHGIRDRIVHFASLSVLRRLVLKCLYAPSAGEGAFAIPRTSRERSFLRLDTGLGMMRCCSQAITTNNGYRRKERPGRL